MSAAIGWACGGGSFQTGAVTVSSASDVQSEACVRPVRIEPRQFRELREVTAMAGGQMCVLVATRPDRLSQVRRRPVVPRCLFGPPDPVENEKLLQEQMQWERDRFQRKYNIDLDLLEAEFEKRLKKSSTVVADVKKTEDERIPPVPTAVQERLLASSDSQVENEEKILKSSSRFPEQKICRKPCVKFQKRVRVATRLKRQTYLTG